MERGYRRKENEFLVSSLRRSGLLISPSYRGPRTDQQIKFLLKTDYDRCSMTQSPRSIVFSRWVSMESGYSITGRRMSFLPLFT